MNNVELGMKYKATQAGQINSLDILKFIMAVAVVVLHVGALYGEPCVYGPAVCWFENLAVPFFFISSGYLIGRHISAQTSADSKAYLRGKSRRYLRLFVVWSLIICLSRWCFIAKARPSELRPCLIMSGV